MEILEEFSDHVIVKGKRSKRQRLAVAVATTSSFSGGGDSPAASSSVMSTGGAVEEVDDDDGMAANCLILLARGESPPTTAAESRRSADCGGYECRTCGKSFPSFQALGGHRASHRKPKSPSDHSIDRKNAPPQLDVNRKDPSPNKTKSHGCGICGSEFGSGQALGGHMRRHRPAGNNTAAADGEKQNRNVLAFDLNMPAPPEDNKFRLFPPPHAVFSAAAAALVHCHY